MKIQFVIGLLIILLATCSVQEAAPADSGLEGQILIGPPGRTSGAAVP